MVLDSIMIQITSQASVRNIFDSFEGNPALSHKIYFETKNIVEPVLKEVAAALITILL